ncbi:MAG: tRNA (cytidine(34)-2'-O)-methyltransferase [Actinomycetes bacterium]|jgi:tRNA (cytidine/uridine-2'-O-)-methyltransferase|nr:MAG: tRNA (uridine(34)/cytosine(34)/5-carboxymethylaminomethyluridine(34)-2'-O)-methyltransferase TrmL [Actinomycetota bacterium]
MFRIVLHQPEIPPNTGNVIRLSACTGCDLDLIEPLGFVLEDKQLRRAGLDYHDLASVTVHPDLEAWLDAVRPERVWAFTVGGETLYTEVGYRPGDAFLFGPESVGLAPEVANAPWVTGRVRLPMVPGVRSLNLSNTVAVAVYEAWRQNGFSRPERDG